MNSSLGSCGAAVTPKYLGLLLGLDGMTRAPISQLSWLFEDKGAKRGLGGKIC
jgi:hypothetical protein